MRAKTTPPLGVRARSPRAESAEAQMRPLRIGGRQEGSNRLCNTCMRRRAGHSAESREQADSCWLCQRGEGEGERSDLATGRGGGLCAQSHRRGRESDRGGFVTPPRACGILSSRLAKRIRKRATLGIASRVKIIHQAIWLYLRFTLSPRDVEDLLAERGVAVSHEAVRRSVNHFGPMIAADLRKRRLKPHGTWYLDEVHLKIDGRMVYLWRAVDAEGEVLDVLVQSKRNKHAALKLMRKLLKKYAFVPERLVTDDLRSYSAAVHVLGIEHCDERGRWMNNRAENSHQPTRRRERKMQRFKSIGCSAEISVNACGGLQHLQRPTPSHLSPNASRAARCGYGHVADGGRSSLTIP